MTKAGKGSRLIVSLALIMLAFLCSLNVTHSYFTASAKESGALNFSDVDVRFIYYKSGYAFPGDYETNSSYTIDLYPTTGSIARGAEFQLSDVADGEAIQYIEIKKMPNTANSYVRCWVDAYIYDSNTKEVDMSVNYGKFFFIKIDEGIKDYFSRGGSDCHVDDPKDDESSWSYFINIALTNSANALSIGNSLIFQDIKDEQGNVVEAIPNDVLGSQLKISMTVEAVQQAHKAFESEFADEKGYYKGWI